MPRLVLNNVLGIGTLAQVYVSLLQEVPAAQILFPQSPYDWGYNLKRRENIGGAFHDKIIPFPRGFGLGGCR